MFQSCSKPLVDVAPVYNFSLFSSEQEGVYGVSFDDLPQTPRSRECSRTLCADTKSSSCLDAMVNQLLLTPEQGRCDNKDITLDSMTAGIFNKPDLIDFQLLTPIKNEKMNAVSTHYSTINESVNASMFCPEGFFPQSASNQMSPTTSESSDQETEITFLNTSRGSSLSISASESTSISQVNEVNDLASNEGSKVHFAPAKVRDRKMCNKSIEARHYHKFSNNRHPGKRMRKLWGKQTKWRTSNGKTPLCGQNRTQNQKPKLGNCLFPNPSISQKRFHKLKAQYDQTFEMFTKPRILFTEEEQKNILLGWENVFVNFVTDQESSRFLQENLNRFTSEQLWYSFTHLQSDFVSICEDVYGNYVAQKYLQFGSNKLRKAIVETLKTSINRLSVSMYGCRVVQKILECGGQKNKLLVAQELSGSIIKMVYDKNGNYVVQKMIQCFRPSEIGFVVDEIFGQTFSLAMHPFGSRVILRLLEKLNRRRVRPLLCEITQHSVILSKNQYGNYIIQWIIKNCVVERRMIVKNLVGRVAELSRDKFGSNVIEAAFRIPGQAQIRELAEELLVNVRSSKGRYSPLALLVGDQFGNYVIQTLLESSSGAFQQRLLRSLRQCGEIKKENKNLLAKVRQISSKSNINVK